MYCSYIFKFFLIIICILLTFKYIIYKPNMYYYGGKIQPYHNNISKMNSRSQKYIIKDDKLYTFEYTNKPILLNTNQPILNTNQPILNTNYNVKLYPVDMSIISPPTKYYSYDIRNTPNIIHNTKYPIIYNNNDLKKYTNRCKVN